MIDKFLLRLKKLGKPNLDCRVTVEEIEGSFRIVLPTEQSESLRLTLESHGIDAHVENLSDYAVLYVRTDNAHRSEIQRILDTL